MALGGIEYVAKLNAFPARDNPPAVRPKARISSLLLRQCFATSNPPVFKKAKLVAKIFLFATAISLTSLFST